MNYLAKAEKAIEYLAETENKYAHLKAQVKYAPERLKAFLSVLEMESDLPSATARKTAAMANDEYDALIEAQETIAREYNVIAEKRRRAEITIEMYRSVNSAMKRGNI